MYPGMGLPELEIVRFTPAERVVTPKLRAAASREV
jgi:hypothetical protein